MTADDLPEAFGFRTGDRGTHSSRTMMLAELAAALSAVPVDATNVDYRRAIAEENVLGKKSAATRRLTAQRLSELYALSSDVPLFRNLRRLWPTAGSSRPVLALLCASARDPLVRLVAPAVLRVREGAPLSKDDLDAALASAIPGRFNDSIRNKIARNAASSFTQAGHISGRAKKARSRPRVTREAAAYALFLGYLCGLRGPALFTTFWASLLDRRPEEILTLAEEASAAGLLSLKQAGPVVDVQFPGWLTPEEETLLHESH
ncbi:MAG: hypothetical protein IPN03_14400 [Holophagales bacterium]|nr:hypothetical protein [Holophagales bacterium]